MPRLDVGDAGAGFRHIESDVSRAEPNMSRTSVPITWSSFAAVPSSMHEMRAKRGKPGEACAATEQVAGRRP
jgi:hypothetical protein